MNEYFQGWQFLAGLGIFLFSIYLLEESIRTLSGNSFKKIIKNYTSNRFNSFASGVFATSILQSSSAVSLLVLAFAGAGIMQLSNAIGVIIGTNVGTSITAWIVAFFGFEFNIKSISIPIVGIGGLGLIFFGKSKLANLSKLLFSFGLLLMGLDLMNESVSEIKELIDLEDIKLTYFWFFLLFGVIVTAIMQSSSAVIAITLTALETDVITFNNAAMIVIGANIGTTITVMLGSIGSSILKKRVSFSHLFFNIISSVLALILLPVLINLVSLVFDLYSNSAMALALFHTSFNVLGAIVFIPFLSIFASAIIKLFPDKTKKYSLFLNEDAGKIATTAIEAIKKELFHLGSKVIIYNSMIFKIAPNFKSKDIDPDIFQKFERMTSLEKYEHLKNIQLEVLTFNFNSEFKDVEQTELNEIERINHSTRLLVYAAKSIKDIHHNIQELRMDDSDFASEKLNEFKVIMNKITMDFYVFLENPNNIEILEEINDYIAAYDKNLHSNLKENIKQLNVKNELLSDVIHINRAIVHSTQQLVTAFSNLSNKNNSLFEIK